MTEEEYRTLPNSEYFSASFLKMFNKEGPEALIKKIKYESKELLKGSVVDDLIFNSDKFESIYHVSDALKEPTSSELTLINNLFELISIEEIKEDSYIKKGLNVIKENKLWNNIKDEKLLINKIKDDNFIKNLESKILSNHKIVISGNDYMNTLSIVNNLKNNKFTKDYFDNSNIKEIQALFQIPIIFNIQEDKFKSLLDIILIDHKNKKIRAVDLKTGHHDNKSFKYTFLKYRYDIQAGLYTKALESYVIQNGLTDYSIENPVFIYTQVGKEDRPLPFLITPSIVKASFKGFTINNNYEYKGILELIDEIKWHRETKVFNYTKEEYENKKSTINENYLGITNYNRSISNDFFINYTRSRNNSSNPFLNTSIGMDPFRSPYEREGIYPEVREQLNRVSREYFTISGSSGTTVSLSDNESQ